MRSSGALAGLDAVVPGDHVCWVVDADAPYAELARRCLDAGDAFNDKVMAFGPEQALGWTETADRPLRGGDPHVAFLGRGPLRHETMFEAFREETALARRQGYRGLRVVADMDWLLADQPDDDDLLAFELRLDEVVAELEATIVCAYRAGSFDDRARARMRAVHPLEYGASQDDLGFRIWNEGDGTWRVTGEVDIANAAAFRTAVAAVATPGTVLRLRLDRLAFIDVAGMRALAAVAREVPGLWLRFEQARPVFRRCWELLEYGTQLPSVELV